MATEQPAYHDRIVTGPEILVGNPTIKGTKIPVDLVLQYLERNPNLDDLFAGYPRLTVENVKACLAHAVEALGEKQHAGRPSPHVPSPKGPFGEDCAKFLDPGLYRQSK